MIEADDDDAIQSMATLLFTVGVGVGVCGIEVVRARLKR
jgi:hypothetical protein